MSAPLTPSETQFINKMKEIVESEGHTWMCSEETERLFIDIRLLLEVTRHTTLEPIEVLAFVLANMNVVELGIVPKETADVVDNIIKDIMRVD